MSLAYHLGVFVRRRPLPAAGIVLAVVGGWIWTTPPAPPAAPVQQAVERVVEYPADTPGRRERHRRQRDEDAAAWALRQAK